MSSDELKIWNPPPKALVAGLTEGAIDPDEPSVETAEVTIDADEAVLEARVVPEVTTALDDETMVVPEVAAALVAVVSDDNGDIEDEDDVTVDASACNALGIAAELSDDTVCTPVPADVPTAWVTAAASPPRPDEDGLVVVVSAGGVKGANVDAADDAPA